MPASKLIMRLMLSEIGQEIEIAEPTLISEKTVREAWNMMNEFIMDMLEELGIEAEDEQFREILIEICYRLILQEMTTLYLLPIREENFKDRLSSGKRTQKLPRRKNKQKGKLN